MHKEMDADLANAITNEVCALQTHRDANAGQVLGFLMGLEEAAKMCEEVTCAADPGTRELIWFCAGITKCAEAIRALKREPSADPGGGIQPVDSESVPAPERMDRTSVTSANHAATTIPAVPVSAPDVAEHPAITRLMDLGHQLWDDGLDQSAQIIELACRELSALLARLGQGWVPMAWMVTWNGETTDDIFCIKGAAIECMARRNRDYPNDTRTIVPLAILPLAPGASDE
jgi:hypothetical protein